MAGQCCYVFLSEHFRYDTGKKCFDGTCVPKTEEVLPGKISTGISGMSMQVN